MIESGNDKVVKRKHKLRVRKQLKLAGEMIHFVFAAQKDGNDIYGDLSEF